jgi:hypothetical protein
MHRDFHEDHQGNWHDHNPWRRYGGWRYGGWRPYGGSGYGGWGS